MKKRLFCIMMVLCVMFLWSLPAAARPIDDVVRVAVDYTITPDFSEGVTLTYNEEEMRLSGHERYGIIVFDETKTIHLTAEFAEGWNYSPYSVFFPNSPHRTRVTESADGRIVMFEFDVVEGESVSVADIEATGIYAAADSLPQLHVDIDIPFGNVTKDAWVDAEFSLTLGTKHFESGNYSGSGSIKGRGNTSWTQPKKPYSIKLDSKESLLDIPRTKKYAIVPSYEDDSLLRNYMTYKAGLMLDGISYTPKCEFLEVYLNGAYNGIYLLVERIDIESTKVDIEEADETNLTGGYLIEKDTADKIDYDSDLWFNCPYWANQARDYFVLKAPEPDDEALTSQMLSYLEGHMQNVHDSIMGVIDTPYTAYVDTASWIDFIIMQEISKNIDGNLKTSCYMYKDRDDDHIYMTALWDFDFAYGNAGWSNADWSHNDFVDCPTGTGTTDFMVLNSSCPWFDHLYDDYPEFRQALQDKYAQYRESLIPEMAAIINEQAAYLSTAAVQNEGMWGKSFSRGVSTLKTWFDRRIVWLDEQWIGTTDDIDLNYAINANGGMLDFNVEGEDFPFVGMAFDGRVAGMSSNSGSDSTESGISISLMMHAGDTVSFDYMVSSESQYDFFRFNVNGVNIFEKSGEESWQNYIYTANEDGEYMLRWSYQKDTSVSAGLDCAFLDNVVYVNSSSEYDVGDVNMDGQITSADALIILRHVVGQSSLSDEQLLLADMNDDGNVTSLDALIVLRLSIQ